VKALPTAVQRRRRLLTRAIPLAAVALVAFVVGAIAGAPGSPEKETAQRFADAWAAGNYTGMYAELNEESRGRISRKAFVRAYREAAEVATLRSIVAEAPADPAERDGATIVPVPLEAGTAAFGRVAAELPVPVAGGGVDP